MKTNIMKTNKINTMRKLILFAAIFAVSFTSTAQVGIGTTNPNASAALDVSSTTKGFLLPRMLKTEMNAIVTPAEGLMVYCNDCEPKGVYYYDGSAFLSVLNGGNPSNFNSTDIYSPATGRVWMDRNLGALQVATSVTDADALGGLYQWGRKTDGHESRTSSAVDGSVTAGSEGSNFIYSTTGETDWLDVSDNTRWQTEAGLNNPCPSGYRVPTKVEFNAELSAISPDNIDGAFALFKFTRTGIRRGASGVINGMGAGHYWTSTVNGVKIDYWFYNGSNGYIWSTADRIHGLTVRCIKN